MAMKEMQVGVLMVCFSLLLVFWLIPAQVEIFSLGSSSEPLLGPRSFPYLISGCMLVLGIFQIAISLKTSPEKSSAPLSMSSRLRVFAVIAVSALYVWLVTLFGYLIPTAVATFLLLYMFGERRLLVSLIISVMTALFLYVVFGKIFHMMMPQGKYELLPWF